MADLNAGKDGSDPVTWIHAAARGAASVDHLGLPAAVCRACVEHLAVDGAALSLTTDRQEPRAMVGASDDSAAQAEELEVTLGEGPSVEAISWGGPVLVSNLATVAQSRWPAYAGAMADGVIRAVFAIPLRLGAITVGVLTMYRRTPGVLSSEDFARSLRAADVIALLLVGYDGRGLSPDFDVQWLDRSSWTREIDQATGMITVQLGVDVEDAFLRLRAHAFAHQLPLSRVARDVVARQLRLDAN